jgi:hypothetical protein
MKSCLFRMTQDYPESAFPAVEQAIDQPIRSGGLGRPERSGDASCFGQAKERGEERLRQTKFSRIPTTASLDPVVVSISNRFPSVLPLCQPGAELNAGDAGLRRQSRRGGLQNSSACFQRGESFLKKRATERSCFIAQPRPMQPRSYRLSCRRNFFFRRRPESVLAPSTRLRSIQDFCRAAALDQID